jgi:hemolysin III
MKTIVECEPLESPRKAPGPREELANSVSHGLGLVAALAMVPLIVSAAHPNGVRAIVGSSVFAATMVLVYLTSTLYHALPGGKAKRVMRILDHAAIFLLIAGTYTPFTLGVLSGTWGWTLFGLIWTLAVAGVALKALGGLRYPRLETILYVAMGWMVLVAVKPLWEQMQPWGFFWLVAGGVAYTAGVGFYAAAKMRYGHLVWHLLVIAGTACHVVAVMRYSA